MNFDFEPEEHLLRDSVRAFLAAEWNTAKLHGLADGEGFDPALWDGLAGIGPPAILVPEAQGGMGLGFVDLALVLEECGRALVPGPLVETPVATDTVVRFGTDEQKAALLPAVAAGRCKMAPAVVEADGGCDPAAVRTVAQDTGADWTLSGRKILVPYAALADKLLVAAGFGPPGTPGLAPVDPRGPGIALRRHKLLDFASRAYEVTFDAAPVARGDVLGGAPSATSVDRLLDAGTAAAARMTGIAAKMLDLAVDYAGQRAQFGRPVESFQAVKHRCADMLVQVETGRTASYYAAWALSSDTPGAAQAVSMAKAYCGDASRFVCNEAIQVHGGIGFA